MGQSTGTGGTVCSVKDHGYCMDQSSRKHQELVAWQGESSAAVEEESETKGG
jgi:hypothetical protein